MASVLRDQYDLEYDAIRIQEISPDEITILDTSDDARDVNTIPTKFLVENPDHEEIKEYAQELQNKITRIAHEKNRKYKESAEKEERESELKMLRELKEKYE